MSPSTAVLFANHPASTPAAPSRIVLQHSLIEFNSGGNGDGNIISFVHQMLTEGESHSLTFQSNLGVGLFLQYALWKESGSVFANNTSNAVGPAFAFTSICRVEMNNFTCVRNVAMMTGGCLSITTESSVEVTDSYFLENFSPQGGVILIEQGAVLQLRRSKFEGNRALFKGATLHVFQDSLSFSSTITDCEFIRNQSPGGVLSLVSSNITFANCSFTGGDGNNPGIVAYLSEVWVVDSTFEGMRNSRGGSVYAPAQSAIILVRCVFQLADADHGAAVFASASTLLVVDSLFTKLNASVGAAIAVVADSQVCITGSRFVSVHAESAGGAVLHLDESQITISTSAFQSFSNGAISGSSVSIAVSDCQFLGYIPADNTTSQGVAIRCEKCKRVSVRHSVCRDVSADSGACLYLAGSTTPSSVVVEDCEFLRSKGGQTGAVFLQNGNSVIARSTFKGNSAVHQSTGDGGALYFACESANCSLSIVDSSFEHNVAARNGGGIAWTDLQPTLRNLTFVNNSAEYGNDLASFAFRLVPTEANFSLESIPSGQKSPIPISMSLVDHYGQVVVTDNSSLADLLPSLNTTLAGITRVSSIKGIFEFLAYEIRHTPGERTSVKVQTNRVKDALAAEWIIPVVMRRCFAGEAEMENLCFQCEEGRFSLNPAEQCKECPTGAECFGRAVMVPRPGYWRSSEVTAVFWVCPNPAACLGSDSVETSPTGKCAEGYFGNMCHGCKSGYSRGRLSHCDLCPKASTNIAVTVGACSALLLLLCIAVKSSLISARSSQSTFSIYFKIFVNYIQLLTFAASLDFSWPSQVLDLLSTQELIGSASQQAFSLDCFFETGRDASQQQAVFSKLLIVSCLPLALCAGALLFWFPVALVRKSKSYLRYHLFNSVALLFFVVHPSVVKLMRDMFNCKEIDKGQFWMNSYLTIKCWDWTHERFTLLVALPSLVTWGFAAPAGALGYLMRNRITLNELTTKIRLGFLYTGFQASNYYWEFVILYRKVIVIVIAVFFATISVGVQALLVSLVLIISFILQVRTKPYVTAQLNQLEQRGVLVAAVTIYSGLFFITKDLEIQAKFLLFAVIVAANAYFCLYWLLILCKSWHPICLRFFIFLKARGLPALRIHPARLFPMHQSSSVMAQSVSASYYYNSAVKDAAHIEPEREARRIPRGRVPDNSSAEEVQDAPHSEPHYFQRVECG